MTLIPVSKSRKSRSNGSILFIALIVMAQIGFLLFAATIALLPVPAIAQYGGTRAIEEPLSPEDKKKLKEADELNTQALVLFQIGKPNIAERFHAQALRTRRAMLGEKHPDTLNSLNNHAFVLGELGRTSESAALHAEALQERRELGGERHPDTIASLNSYAGVLKTLGRSEEAEQLYTKALQHGREMLGDMHPTTRISKNNLAAVRIGLPSRSHLTLDPVRALVADIRAARQVAGFTPGEEAQLGREEKNQSGYFRLFADAAWVRGPGLVGEAKAVGAEPLDSTNQARLREEAFAALQDALANTAGKAISAAVARKAAGPLGPLVIERDELSQQWLETDRTLVKSLSNVGGSNDDKRVSLRTRLASLASRMKEIDQRLKNDAPDYFAMIRPEALSLKSAQEVFGEDEAALMVVPTEFGTHIMLVSDDGLRWARSQWTRKKST